jgi:hypothetical protein
MKKQSNDAQPIVKLKINEANIIKRIPVPVSFEQLKLQASQLL